MTRVSKEKKSMRWYRKLEYKLRECAIFNAYIIEGTVNDHIHLNQRKRDLLSFKTELAHSLIGNFRSRKCFKRPRSANNDELRLDGNDHWPTAAGGSDRVCVVCNRKHRNYMSSHPGTSVKDAPFKRTKTTMACQKCNAALCCNARSTCFTDYHTKVYFWQ